MQVVRSHQRVTPISIEEALESVSNVIVDVAKKNRTLIDYYIDPMRIPAEIEAYKPRLELLHARVRALAEFDMHNLGKLIDQAVAVVADFILPIIDQLLSAIRNIQSIFIHQYDPELVRRQPYATAYDVLQYRGSQLEQLRREQLSYSLLKPAESLSSRPPSATGERVFCPYAIAFANHRDQGGLSHVLQEKLTREEKERLRTTGGAFLSWDCPGCAFSLRYHVNSSAGSNIMSTDDVRTHGTAHRVQYRPSWLVKCHLYRPQTKERRGSSSGDDSKPVIGQRRSTMSDTRRSSVARRPSETMGPRSSGSLFWLGGGKRSNSVVVINGNTTTSLTGQESVAKYGCPFCFANGRESRHMSYRNGKELAEHIAERHHVHRAPPGLMLEKYQVGIDGQCSDGIRRWDLNLGARGD